MRRRFAGARLRFYSRGTSHHRLRPPPKAPEDAKHYPYLLAGASAAIERIQSEKTEIVLTRYTFFAACHPQTCRRSGGYAARVPSSSGQADPPRNTVSTHHTL